MRLFFNQLKWQFVILYRNYLITISIAMTAIYVLIFFIARDLGNLDKILTLLIYNDPALIGLFFLGMSIIIDKNQHVLPALFVTPINLHVFLITRMLALSTVGWLCGLSMGIAALGWSFHYVHFSFGVFGTCFLFSLVGIYLVSFTQEFLQFTLRSIPILMAMSLPLLNYFNLTDIGFFYLFPIQGCLNLIVNSYSVAPLYTELIYGYLSTAIWLPLLYSWVFKLFKKKLVNR